MHHPLPSMLCELQWEVVNKGSPFFHHLLPATHGDLGHQQPALHRVPHSKQHSSRASCQSTALPAYAVTWSVLTTICAIFLPTNLRPSFMSRHAASMFLWPQSPVCSHVGDPCLERCLDAIPSYLFQVNTTETDHYKKKSYHQSGQRLLEGIHSGLEYNKQLSVGAHEAADTVQVSYNGG